MRKILRSRVAAVSIGALVVVGLGAGGATAAGMIGSDDIRNNAVAQEDLGRDSVGASELRDNTVGPRYLTDDLLSRINQPGKPGRDGTNGAPGASAYEVAVSEGFGGTKAEWLASLKGDKGADGVAGVQTDGPYTATWAGDGGESLQTARVFCPEGKAAIGGGFSTWGGDAQDLGGDNKNIQVTVSAPSTSNYVPVNEQGSFVADQWVVKGYNNGTTDQVVRPWVVCAKVG